jgi:hypothetical protein
LLSTGRAQRQTIHWDQLQARGKLPIHDCGVGTGVKDEVKRPLAIDLNGYYGKRIMHQPEWDELLGAGRRPGKRNGKVK